MDDSRSLFPPIKAGWKWEEGKLTYTKRWELVDGMVSGDTMVGVETYLKFTMESGEEFKGGWLPTIYTNQRVGRQLQIKF